MVVFVVGTTIIPYWYEGPYGVSTGLATATRFSVVSVVVLVTDELPDRRAELLLECDTDVPERAIDVLVRAAELEELATEVAERATKVAESATEVPERETEDRGLMEWCEAPEITLAVCVEEDEEPVLRRATVPELRTVRPRF